MSMQIGLGIVGAVIGGYIGGPAGASIGFTLGSAIGAAAFPPEGPHLQGPRLSDLHGTVSTYGATVPRIYGEVGCPANIIWMDPIEETVTESDVGGKGGPTATQTNYSYSASFAIALVDCEPGEPISSLNRIWINGKCYYDVRDEANIEVISASQAFAEFFTFYSGNYTQEPDPTIEASLGVGNVPAYRGTSYIVFTDLPLEWFHNAPPGSLQIICELVKTGTPSSGMREIHAADGLAGAMIYPLSSSDGLVRTQDSVTSGTWLYTLDGTAVGTSAPTEYEATWPLMFPAPSEPDSTLCVSSMFDGTNVRAYITGTQLNSVSMRLYAGTPSGTQYSLLSFLPPTHYFQGAAPCADLRHICVLTGAIAGSVDAYWIFKWNGVPDGWELISNGATLHAGAAYGKSVGPAGQGYFYGACMESDLLHLWATSGVPGCLCGLWEIDPATGTMDFVDDILSPSGFFTFSSSMLWADKGFAWTKFDGAGYYRVFTRNVYAATNAADLADVIEGELLLAGLDVSQIDVSALVGIAVDGVLVARVSATRGVIANLQRAYWFDLIESQGQLKAVLKGGASVATITQDDLCASESLSSDAQPVESDRADEDSLPGSISVIHIDKSIDYQVGAQEDRRAAVLQEQPQGVDLGLVLSSQKAKDIASVLLYDAWTTRNRRTFRTSRKYSYLDPGDVVTLELDDMTLVVTIVKIKIAGGVMEFEAVDADASLYDPNTEAASVGSPSTLVPVLPSDFALMDLPPLRSADDNAGFYFAAAGYSTEWPGAQLLVSTDGGATYSSVSATDNPASLGTVSGTLGNYTGGNFIDAASTLTVQLLPSSPALTSVTADELLEGANIAAVGSESNGWELIQFKTATLVTGTTYALTGLLRGRLGTEDKIGTHEDYERFVLLTTQTVRRVLSDVASLGTSRTYKCVTSGQRVSSAIEKSFTNNGRSLECYSPVNAQATGFGGDIEITWNRRGRLVNGWNNSIDVPLSEETESYSIDIYDGPDVIRTLTSSTTSVTYDSADQTTDFGSPPSSIDVGIYQLSALVGRGLPCIATLS